MQHIVKYSTKIIFNVLVSRDKQDSYFHMTPVTKGSLCHFFCVEICCEIFVCTVMMCLCQSTF